MKMSSQASAARPFHQVKTFCSLVDIFQTEMDRSGDIWEKVFVKSHRETGHAPRERPY